MEALDDPVLASLRAFVPEEFGAFGVFVFVAAAMAIVMATIGFFGPRTTNLALERIAH